MLFTHLYVESGKLMKPNAVGIDKNTKLDQTLLMKKSTWVISGRLLILVKLHNS